jgi:hypothetical protein
MANVDYILKLSRQFCKIADHFDLEEFSSLPTGIETGKLSPERHAMLSQLPISGIGGSRNTYVLSSKKAIKVAKNGRGLEGNKIEFENLKKYDSVWLPKVFNRANDYSWIEVEFVRPLNDKKEITNLTGIDGDWFIIIMMTRNREKSMNEAIDFLIRRNEKHLIKIPNSPYLKANDKIIAISLLLNSYKNNPFLMELDQLITEANLEPYEFSLIENLGKSITGHLVLLDIGGLKE